MGNSQSHTEHVRTGIWTDTSRPFGFQTQWLDSQGHANILTNLLGVLVPIAMARLIRLLMRVLYLLGKLPEEPKDSVEHFLWNHVRVGLDTLNEGAHTVGQGSGPSQGSGPPVAAKRQTAARLFLNDFVLGVLFIGILTCGIVTALLANNSIALSNHPDCGLYLPQGADLFAQLNVTRPYESATQIESAALAKRCFKTEGGECGTFLDPSFSIEASNWTCPWPAHMCHGKGTQPIRITTNAVRARKIGINDGGRLEFNRTSICSPLNMNRTYVNLVKQEGSKYTFGYYYGRSLTWPPASYQTVRRGDRGDVPTYELGVLRSAGRANGPNPEWQSLPELVPRAGSVLTLVIVVSQKINYLQRMSDPIFPADDETHFEGDPRTYYINLSGPGTVFACLDTIEWRDPRFGSHWTPVYIGALDGADEDTQSNRGLWLLLNSLVGSEIYNALNARLGSALDAQGRISSFVSLPLAAEQWKVEARQLFETTLARILINARDIALGTKSGYWGYQKEPPNDVNICKDTYLVNTTGLININFTGWLWIFLLSLLCFFLSIPITVINKIGDEEDGMFIERLLEWLVSPWYWCRNKFAQIQWKAIGSAIKRAFVESWTYFANAASWLFHI